MSEGNERRIQQAPAAVLAACGEYYNIINLAKEERKRMVGCCAGG